MADFPVFLMVEAVCSEIFWLCLMYMYENVKYGKVMCSRKKIICILDISSVNVEDIVIGVSFILFGRETLEEIAEYIDTLYTELQQFF